MSHYSKVSASRQRTLIEIPRHDPGPLKDRYRLTDKTKIYFDRISNHRQISVENLLADELGLKLDCFFDYIKKKSYEPVLR